MAARGFTASWWNADHFFLVLLSHFCFVITVSAAFANISRRHDSVLGSASSPPSSPPPHQYHHLIVKSSAHNLLVVFNEQVITNVTTTMADVKSSREDYTPWERSSGIYVHVFHPDDGRLMFKKVLTTLLYGSALEVPSVLKSLTPGHLVVLAVKNDAAQNLTPLCRRMLFRLGVKSALHLEKREFLAWVGTLGGPVWGEAWTMDAEEELGIVWSAGLALDLYVPRMTYDMSCFSGAAGGSQEAARATFCRQYDGYGDLCLCPHPAPLTYHPPQLHQSIISDVPLILMANNRPNYLYKALVNLLRQPGGSIHSIFVFVDGPQPEVTALLDLLQVRYEVRAASGVAVGAKISDQYRYALTHAFTHFPNASKVIVLEEDLLASPDFFSYFNQTSWLLDADPSLMCVSAWSDLGSLHVAHDPHVLRRVEVVAGLGWMATRRYIQELLTIWPDSNTEHDWDIWVRQPGVLGGRECVVPDVSRTFHIGLTGSHAAMILHAAFYSYKPVPAHHYVPLYNVHKMTQQAYEEQVSAVLQGDVAFFSSFMHPCSPHYVPRDFKEKPLVMFIEMNNMADHYAWQVLARCLGLFDMDTRSHHRGLFHFYFYDTEVMVVGYPYSDYSYLKPAGLSLLAVNTSQEITGLEMQPLANRVRFRKPELERRVPYLDLPMPNFY